MSRYTVITPYEIDGWFSRSGCADFLQTKAIGPYEDDPDTKLL